MNDPKLYLLDAMRRQAQALIERADEETDPDLRARHYAAAVRLNERIKIHTGGKA